MHRAIVVVTLIASFACSKKEAAVTSDAATAAPVLAPSAESPSARAEAPSPSSPSVVENAARAVAPVAPVAAAPKAVDAGKTAADLARERDQQRRLAEAAEQMQLTPLAALGGGVAGGPSASVAPPLRPAGGQPGGLAGSTTGPVAVKGPSGDVNIGGSSASVPIADADRVIAGLRPRARQCYNTGLQSDPTMAGKLVMTIRVKPGGEVASATATSNSGLSPSVASCVERVCRGAQFTAPGASGSQLTVPMTFVQTR